MDYRDQWRDLGYPDGLASASFLPPPSNAFVRAYHLLSSCHAIDDITRQRLKVCRFSEANDPFELLGLNCHGRTARKLTKQFTTEQNDRYGFLSFSANWNSPMLWSHYGAKHEGICLGFDLRRTTVETVEYAGFRLRSALPDDDEPEITDDVRARLRRMKSSEWSYEQEVRRIVELTQAQGEGARYFWPFGDDRRLAEVIVGPRCDRSVADVQTVVSDHGSQAVVFQARLARRKFKVVLDGHTRPA